MKKVKTAQLKVPRFASEDAEADWWASAEGRAFLAAQPAKPAGTVQTGSKLVARLVKAGTVQIALRLPSPDLDKARRIAERKGIGYQTLLKMLVHEGLERMDRPAI
ncbi:MAG: hypothetical protein FJW40_20820 [Acidobacteria bacterium]|nr:hypothetical protein [Acidobacteriota bacterium]